MPVDLPGRVQPLVDDDLGDVRRELKPQEKRVKRKGKGQGWKLRDKQKKWRVKWSRQQDMRRHRTERWPGSCGNQEY